MKKILLILNSTNLLSHLQLKSFLSFNEHFQSRFIYIFMPLLSSPSHNNMSISTFHLLLFLICISFHASHSHILHLADNNTLQAPIKGKHLAKIDLSWDKPAIEWMKSSPPKAVEERENVIFKREKCKRRRKQLKRVRLEEVKKVSWRVPDDDDHKKVKDNGDVFSSDYEHARTHPPSHN